jgi:hypothetical protein
MNPRLSYVDSQCVLSTTDTDDELLVCRVIRALAAESPKALPAPRPAVDDVIAVDGVDMPALYREFHGLGDVE